MCNVVPQPNVGKKKKHTNMHIQMSLCIKYVYDCMTLKSNEQWYTAVQFERLNTKRLFEKFSLTIKLAKTYVLFSKNSFTPENCNYNTTTEHF